MMMWYNSSCHSHVRGAFVVSRQRAVNLYALPVTVTSTGNHRLAAFCVGVTMDTKYCKKCKEHKPVSEFGKDRSREDGLGWRCKACDSAKAMDYHVRNRDSVLKKLKRKYRRNRDRYLENARDYYEAKKDEIKAATERYRKAHPEKYSFYGRRRVVKKHRNGGKHTFKEWQDLLDFYGRKCLRCGSTENITQDHVIPLHLGGSDDIDNIQPLCRSCNSKKNARRIDYRILIFRR